MNYARAQARWLAENAEWPADVRPEDVVGVRAVYEAGAHYSSYTIEDSDFRFELVFADGTTRWVWMPKTRHGGVQVDLCRMVTEGLAMEAAAEAGAR